MTKKAQKGGKGRGDHRPTRGGGGGGQRGNLSATDHELLTELRDQREQAQKRKDRLLLVRQVKADLLAQGLVPGGGVARPTKKKKKSWVKPKWQEWKRRKWRLQKNK